LPSSQGSNPTAWLLGILWVLKVVPGIPGLRQLRRVLMLESGPLLGVLVIFLIVVFITSVAEYVLERDVQPATFGSVPAALWWAVVTLTMTGYGDVVPITPMGRNRRCACHDLRLGVFGLFTGILATGFAAETRRDNFLKTWASVSKVPFFADLGPAAIADVTNMLRTMDLPARRDHPQGPAGRLHVFHRRRRGRGRIARQEGHARRGRVLR
jgi:voltage-gated potassium channel